MEFNTIRAELDYWRTLPTLSSETNLLARAECLDFLYFATTMLPDLSMSTEAIATLQTEIDTLAAALKAIDNAIFAKVRLMIATGELRGATLRAYFERYIPAISETTPVPGAVRPHAAPPETSGVHTNYGALDILIDGIFALHDAPAPTIKYAEEMVHCEETPAQVILHLADQLTFTPHDRFYDLGSGLGQVVMLVHLLCGIRTCGVDIEPAFVDFARAQANSFNLCNVHFLHGDAQKIDYQDGTVFFLFTPFRGKMLRTVLGHLRTVAKAHPIRVCTFGPCTPQVAAEPWLQSRSQETPHEYKLTIFDSQL